MAEEKGKKKGEHEGGEHEGKKARKHLKKHEIEETEDGHFVHHQTYTPKRGHPAEEKRMNTATSMTPEEAGQHATEQFQMNQPPQEGEDPGAMEEAEGGAGGGGAAAMPGA